MLCRGTSIRYQQRHCHNSNLASVCIHLYYCVLSFPFCIYHTFYPQLRYGLFAFSYFSPRPSSPVSIQLCLSDIRETRRVGLRTTEEPLPAQYSMEQLWQVQSAPTLCRSALFMSHWPQRSCFQMYYLTLAHCKARQHADVPRTC
jgi:hypothetical protein